VEETSSSSSSAVLAVLLSLCRLRPAIHEFPLLFIRAVHAPRRKEPTSHGVAEGHGFLSLASPSALLPPPAPARFLVVDDFVFFVAGLLLRSGSPLAALALGAKLLLCELCRDLLDLFGFFLKSQKRVEISEGSMKSILESHFKRFLSLGGL
jgi:hypothetical protein